MDYIQVYPDYIVVSTHVGLRRVKLTTEQKIRLIADLAANVSKEFIPQPASGTMSDGHEYD